MRDYYEILGVSRGCDEAALKSAFRKLAMEHHPDRNGGCEEAAGRFKEINEAYSVLSDAKKRAAYDQFGHAGVNGPQGGPGGFGGADMNDIFSEVFGDVFGDMFGGRQRRSGPSRGQDLRYDLEITLEQAYAGADVEIKVPAAMTCETCEGTGAKAGTSPTACTSCGGAGRVRRSQGFFSIESACPRCGGSLESRSAGHELVCLGCGRAQFPRTDPAVIMAVTFGEPGADDEELLLGRQAVWPPGRFSTLAGFCEPGESLEDAVRREVLEEVGVPVGEVTYFGNQAWPFPSSLMLGFTARALSQGIVLDQDEIEDARWFTRDSMRRAAEAGEVVLPGGVSISRSLVETWFGGPLPGTW